MWCAFDAHLRPADPPRPHEEPSMNGPDPYDRRLDRLPDEAAPHPKATQSAEPPSLAVRRDPSQQPLMPSQQSPHGIACVRPTELAMRVGDRKSTRPNSSH